jgi:hypothetical protein
MTDHVDVMQTLQRRECVCMYCDAEQQEQYVKLRTLFVFYIDHVVQGVNRVADAVSDTALGIDHEKVHAAFMIMDVFFSRSGELPTYNMARPFLCAALLIACKLHSNEPGVFYALSAASTVAPGTIRTAELYILNAMKWRVTFTTTHEYLVTFNTVGMFAPHDTCKGQGVDPAVRQRVLDYVQYFANRIVRTDGTFRFRTSILSAAAWCMARRMCAVEPEWGPAQVLVTWHTRAELGECIEVTSFFFLFCFLCFFI